MHHHRFLRLLVLPSLFSSVLSVLTSIGIIVGINWSLLVDNLPFYDYFFGSDGTVTNLQGSSLSVASIDQMVHSKSFTILLAVLFIAAVIALAVRSIAGIISSIAWTVQQIQAVDSPAKQALERELSKRIGARIIIALVWVGYIFVWVKVVLPFAILASQLGFSWESSVGEGISYLLFALALLLASIHLHVVMGRLLLLRPRVFGGEEALLVS